MEVERDKEKWCEMGVGNLAIPIIFSSLEAIHVEGKLLNSGDHVDKFVETYAPPNNSTIRKERESSQLARLPNGDQEVMGSTPTFHNGIQ